MSDKPKESFAYKDFVECATEIGMEPNDVRDYLIVLLIEMVLKLQVEVTDIRGGSTVVPLTPSDDRLPDEIDILLHSVLPNPWQ